jgi:hypothetical protein
MAREGGTGDFRNPQRVRAWAQRIARDLQEALAGGPGRQPSDP